MRYVSLNPSRGREPWLAAADTLLRESGCQIMIWTSGSYGRAFTSDPRWLINVPEPRGPVSFGIFAHEVGHQMLHRHNSAPRWLEEIEAWEYALSQFDRFELPRRARAETEAANGMLFAARKALRRCSPKTAEEILERMPTWVWEHEAAVV